MDDTVLELAPRVRVLGEGGQVSLKGEASVRAVSYVRKTQQDRLLPEGNLEARLEAIEKLVYLESGIRSFVSSEDPFSIDPAEFATSNVLSSTVGRLSAALDTGQRSNIRLRGRTDNSYLTSNGSTFLLSPTSSRTIFHRHSASAESEPRPLGFSLLGSRSSTRFLDGVSPAITVDELSAGFNYLITSDLNVGLRAGKERDSQFTGDDVQSTAMALVSWRPSTRTSLDGEVERRTAGRFWKFSFSNRQPMLAWRVELNKDLSTAVASLFDLPATGDVASLVDAMLVSRFPDPLERARQVQEFINQQGLPSVLNQSTPIVSRRLSVVTGASASLAILGSRNTLTLSLNGSRTRDASDAGPFATGLSSNNNTRYGVTASLSHRLTPVRSISATVEASRTTALPDAGAERTHQGLVQVQLSERLTERTTARYGMHHRRLASNVYLSGRETTILANLEHVF